MGIAEIRGEKIGGGVGYWIIFAKQIMLKYVFSLQNTFRNWIKYKLHAVYLITYLYFNYLSTLQINTQDNLCFSRALPAAHALVKYTKLCMVWQRNIRNNLWACLRLDPAARPPVPPKFSHHWLRQFLLVDSFSARMPLLEEEIISKHTLISNSCQNISIVVCAGLNESAVARRVF